MAVSESFDAEKGDRPTTAVGLLENFLKSRNCYPDQIIAELFREAGRISPAFQEHLITSERLLFAAVELGTRGDPTLSLLSRFSALIRRDIGAFDRVFSNFRAGIQEPEISEMRVRGFTDNVERTLDAACAMALGRQPTGRAIVTVEDFLAGFPPNGSVAYKVLAQLGIRGEHLLSSILRPTPMEDQAEITSIADEGAREIDEQKPGRSDTRTTKKALKKTSEKESPKKAQTPNDRVATHADEPAEIDQLGRRPFAEVLARRIREARDSGDGDEPSAFIVHIHGPWGSGKSSTLNFLENDLRATPPTWVIVKFNAWRDQRLQPPWWSLITTIYSAARSELSWRAALKLRLRWFGWRIRADYLPVVAVVVCALALLLLVLWVGDPVTVTPGNESDAVAKDQRAFAEWLDRLLKLAAAAITVIGAIILGSKSLAMGSQRAAQAYADLKNDPYRPIAKLFNRLVSAIDRPVAVFIDDLDRCDSKYVVDLLEGIQTLMRGAPVTYVVAADRKWICSSFEQRYSGFSPPIGEIGRPLGYLFLDKVFQISAALPQPSSEAQASYWANLLDANPHNKSVVEQKRRKDEKVAEAQAAQLTRQEDLQKLVTKAEEGGDESMIHATRAAAAKRITSKDASIETEHRLRNFAHLLEPNPRSMKRLVNSYGMHQATLLLAGRAVAPEALARWTILELRWPLLADFLAARSSYVDKLRQRLAEADASQVPASLRDLFGDPLVGEVLGKGASRDRLNAAAVNTILGAVQGDR